MAVGPTAAGVVVVEEPVGQVAAGGAEQVRPRPAEPCCKGVEALPRRAAGSENGRRSILDRVFGRFWADDAHRGIDRSIVRCRLKGGFGCRRVRGGAVGGGNG